jgi:hypothetical protein
MYICIIFLHIHIYLMYLFFIHLCMFMYLMHKVYLRPRIFPGGPGIVGDTRGWAIINQGINGNLHFCNY